MAATVSVPVLVGTAFRFNDGVGFPGTLTTRWMAGKLDGSGPAEISIDTAIASSAPLVQADWDAIWTAVLAAYASRYANAPSVAPPILIHMPDWAP